MSKIITKIYADKEEFQANLKQRKAQLKTNIVSFKKNDPQQQQEFLKKYLFFLTQLEEMKKLLENTAESEIEFTQEDIMEQLKERTQYFTDFIKQSGFVD